MKRLFFFLFIFIASIVYTTVFIKPALAADICEGYAINASGKIISNIVNSGICYFYTDTPPKYTTDDTKISCTTGGDGASCNNSTLPSCSEMTSKDYHHTAAYHVINDAVQACPFSLGIAYKCCAPNTQTTPAAPPPPCSKFKGAVGQSQCLVVNTALGLIPTTPAGLVTTVFGILLGLSGGIALILIIFSGYQLMASGGNPEKVKEARERLTSAIVGLIFIIFSFAIFQTITAGILQLPGFH